MDAWIVTLVPIMLGQRCAYIESLAPGVEEFLCQLFEYKNLLCGGVYDNLY